jgi:hypothetical protein
MMAYRDGDAVIAPRRAEGADALGDGYVRLEPDDPDYEVWDGWLTQVEQHATKSAPVAAATGRDPSVDETASGADFAAHQEAWQSAFTDLQTEWPVAAQPMADDLAQQAGDDVANDKLADLAGLAVSAAIVTALAAVIAAAMLRLAGKAAAHVVAEAASQGKKISAPKRAGADRVDEVAQVVAGLIANGYATAAARRAMQVASSTATAADVATAVSETLTAMSNAPTGFVADNLRAALSAAQNAGRAAVFEAHPPKTLIASEIIDDNTCVPCDDVDGQRFGSLTEADAAYPVHGYVNCLGGDRCRGMVLGLWR